MEDSLKLTIELLKKRVKYNLGLIHNNEEAIREILKEPVSENRSNKLNQRFYDNKKLIKENNDALKIQRDIISYLEKFHSELSVYNKIEIEKPNNTKSISINTKIEIKREDYFELTVNKAIEFDHRHPYYHDEDFANDLMVYFIEIEDYEMCASLSKRSKNQTADK